MYMANNIDISILKLFVYGKPIDSNPISNNDKWTLKVPPKVVDVTWCASACRIRYNYELRAMEMISSIELSGEVSHLLYYV